MQNEKFQIYEPGQIELNQEQLQIQKPMVEWVQYQRQTQIIEVYELEGFYYIKESAAIALGLTQNTIDLGGENFYIITYEIINELEQMGYVIKYYKISAEKRKELKLALNKYSSSGINDIIKNDNNYNNNYENFKEDYIEETNRNKTR